MNAAAALRDASQALWRRSERGLDALAGSASANPLRHLGALGFLCFWLLAASGIVLYAVLDTSAAGAYRSMAALSQQPWYRGGWLRSLHRYAADAFVVFMLAHLAREWLFGRYRSFRRFSWLTGVPLLAFAFVCAIGGFWLNWDRLGQFSAIATAEWLDALPLFASPLTRNFIGVASLGDRLFSLLVFIHLGVPLLLVFGLWFHVQRIARAAVFPPRGMAVGTALTLVALAVALPVVDHGAADLARVPQVLALDWWLLFVHPLMIASSPEAMWWWLGGTFALLVALPWLPAPAAAPVAVVDAAHCNGCRRCVADCPTAAITMVPHPNARIGRELAQVDADLCAGCGICVGACPSATPFRRATELVTGIDMPQQPLAAVRAQLQRGLAAHAGARPVVVFGCERGAAAAARDDTGLSVAISLLCAGQLPPSFVEYALRGGAAGVLVAGCRGCEYRLGMQWTQERVDGRREPALRAAAAHGRVATVWADAGEEPRVADAVRRLRRRCAEREVAAHE